MAKAESGVGRFPKHRTGTARLRLPPAGRVPLGGAGFQGEQLRVDGALLDEKQPVGAEQELIAVRQPRALEVALHGGHLPAEEADQHVALRVAGRFLRGDPDPPSSVPRYGHA